ncbi:MAG TPA: hypothetical protein VKE74_08025, partial [Gemmataceae bacterium]|nr:hypothetical protein [Gemmataceae bacterium]
AVFEGTSVVGTSVAPAKPAKLLNDFFAFPGPDTITLRNGAFVAAGDFNGDGFADLAFGGGPGGGPRVFVLSGDLIRQGLIDQAQNAPIANFFAFDSSQRGGVHLSAKEGDADGDRELVVGSGEGQAPSVHVFPGTTLRGGAPPSVASTPFTDPTLAAGVFVG